jgi:UDP-N-acetylglucosamine/UDP-N-acetylgalactosamine diphosphorylase
MKQTTKEQLLSRLAPFGQEHLVAFWDQLDDVQRQSLAGEIGRVDFGLLDQLHRRAREGGGTEEIRTMAARAVPPPALRLGQAANRFSPQDGRRRGLEALAAGQVGVMLVAGGQGTRLGYDHPKGMYPIGPVSGHSFFQIHLEKIVAAARRHGVAIPLYLMTSPATDAETREYLEANERFGLAEQHLRIFCQGTMPAVDARTGKVLLDRCDHLALSPDGHGGMLAAFVASGALDDARRRGVRHLFYFQVDNPLVEIGGPEFLGHHLLARSELSSQVVAKQDPLARVGNVVEVDGRLRVIEYSDLPEELANRRNPDGSLAIWAGSIAVHVMDLDFLARMAGHADGLPFHVARKRVPYVDASGRRVEPGEKEKNALKFERFIFDLLPSADNALVVEIDPADGFAPVKNGPGEKEDTPESARAAMVALHTRWLRRAGAEVADGVPVEISPLFALDAEEAAAKIRPGTTVTKATYFG